MCSSDLFSADINEILIDTPDVYEQAVQFMNHVMPGNVARVKLYQDEIPLFSRFQIEHQIESAFSREVRLPSGGAIVIDHTEALVSVDVNSGRSIKGADIEQTAYNTNLEAAEEVARQLRLRDLGGLVVIDFIDMESTKNQRDVENTLRDALHADRARVQTGKISRFGLLELSRQRLRPSLGETNHAACPRCSGTGHIRGIESTALHILRITQEEAMKDNSAIIQVQLPVEAATFLLNEKRADIHKIEQRMGVEVVLIPNIHMETPNYTIVRIKHDDVNEETSQASYKMVEMPAETAYVRSLNEEVAPKSPEALVKGIKSATSAPLVAERSVESKIETKAETKAAAPIAKLGIFGRIKQLIVGKPAVVEEKVEEQITNETRNNNGDRNRGNNRDRNSNQERNRNRDRSANSRDRNNTPERGDKPQQAPRAQQAANSNQQARPERTPRPERSAPERASADKQLATNKVAENVEATESATVANAQVGVDANAPRPERTGRSRRGGRNRNKNRDRDQNRDLNAEPPAFVPNDVVAVAAPVFVNAAPVDAPIAKASKEKPLKAAPKSKAAPKQALTPIAVDSNIEIVATKPVAASAEALAKPKAEKQPKAKTAKKPAAKPVKAVAPISGDLQMVETKGNVSAAPTAADIAQPKAPRKAPNWKKETVANNADAPLIIVQTQK